MNKNTQQKDKFPYIRWLGGACLGAILGYSHTMHFDRATDTIITLHSFWFYFLILAICGVIPMLIAYKRQIKNANKAYWFSFASMCAPAGIVWFVIGLCIAIFDKKFEKDSKN